MRVRNFGLTRDERRRAADVVLRCLSGGNDEFALPDGDAHLLAGEKSGVFDPLTGELDYAKPPTNAYDPAGPKAPGKPGATDGFKDPKGGDNWVPNPNGGGNGWLDANGNVWVPTGQGGGAHGGPHWDVQTPGGGYDNIRPKLS
jgi:hypothetical protein